MVTIGINWGPQMAAETPLLSPQIKVAAGSGCPSAFDRRHIEESPGSVVCDKVAKHSLRRLAGHEPPSAQSVKLGIVTTPKTPPNDQ